MLPLVRDRSVALNRCTQTDACHPETDQWQTRLTAASIPWGRFPFSETRRNHCYDLAGRIPDESKRPHMTMSRLDAGHHRRAWWPRSLTLEPRSRVHSHQHP